VANLYLCKTKKYLYFQALTEFLNTNKAPELLVMGAAIWSICCKPNHTMALEEYNTGLNRLTPVIYLPFFKPKITSYLTNITQSVMIL
jgi:hypothetical protein